MIRGRRLLKYGLLAVVLAGAGKMAWDYAHSSYRFRMTVEVETPEGLRTGSSVMEVYAFPELLPLPESAKAHVSLRGEAVAVDLPGGVLFVLLPWGNGENSMEWIATKTLDATFNGGAEGFLKTVPELSRATAIGRSGIVDPKNYPLMARFESLSRPSSVLKVDPNRLPDELGADNRIKKIEVAVVNEPVTRHIRSVLPWLGEGNHISLHRATFRTFDPSFAQLTSDYNFYQGLDGR